MTANYHTPFAFNAGITSAAINAVLSQLDTGITGAITRVGVLETKAAGTVATSVTLGASTELTIASGAVTLNGSRYHTIDTEGDVALDYLDTIHGNAGDIFYLKLENAARLVTIRHLATNGNIILSPAANFSYVGTTQVVRGFHDGTYAYLFAPEYQAESYAYLEDQKAQNTAGGTFTSGAWRTRNLNVKVYDPDIICAIQKLPFTSGGVYQIVDGDTITGATSGKTGVVFDVELTGGSWAAGSAAGNLWIYDTSGDFVAENLNVGANLNVATIAANFTYNQIRLKAGTYRIEAQAPAYYVNTHKARWYNITAGAAVQYGTTEICQNAYPVTNRSFIGTRFTIAVPTTYELQHACANTTATYGFGYPSNLALEVYSRAHITKEL